MNPIPRKILAWAGSRFARNVYFWVLLFLLKQSDVESYHDHPRYWYYGLMLFFLSFFIVLSGINNFFLVPRFLAKKKYFVYFPLIALLLFVFAFTYTWLLKYMLVHLPGVDPFRVSIVSSPLSADTGFSSVLDEMSTNCSVMTVWVMVYTLLWYFNDYSKKMKRMQETINQHVATELSFLKSQINPHFLFNTLNNLYGLALKRSDETPDTILKLSSIMRYLLYESNVELVSFEKEEEVMRSYIDLELLRIPGKHDFQFTIKTDHSAGRLPPLLWLPVLENIFKHGTRIIRDELMIDFQFIVEKGRLLIHSKNKFSTMQDGVTGGIGLSNLRKRLALLYPGKHSISSGVVDGYYETTIEVQLNG